MKRDAKTRVRKRIQSRLDELGMTGRELARACGHDDAWISGLLKGSQGLLLRDFDLVADKLGLSPSELVRHDDAEVREVSPSEMRLLRHFQNWPIEVRDKWLDVLDHFASTVPDQDTAALLSRLRELRRPWRRTALAWIFRLLEEGLPPEVAHGGVVLGPGEGAIETHTKRHADPGQKSLDNRMPHDGPHAEVVSPSKPPRPRIARK